MSILSDLFGGDDSYGEVRGLMDENKRLYEGLELPEYKEFVPELYNSEGYNYKTIEDNPLIKSRQEQLLAELAGLKDTGLSDVDKAVFDDARRTGSEMARANTQAAIQDAQNRGVSGSGMEFAMREIANQGGAQRAHQQAMQQAAESARQRALYAQAYGNELGSQRQADYNTTAANTDIINDFNTRNTQQRNQVNNANVDQRNSAFQYNQGLKDKQFGNQLAKIGGQTGANQGIANAVASRGAAEQSDRNALLGVGAQLGAAYLGRK
jgi:hypothetical protein